MHQAGGGKHLSKCRLAILPSKFCQERFTVNLAVSQEPIAQVPLLSSNILSKEYSIAEFNVKLHHNLALLRYSSLFLVMCSAWQEFHFYNSII
jgi:hypothetical protein